MHNYSLQTLSASIALLLLSGAAASAATITLPGVTLHGTITYQSSTSFYGDTGVFTGGVTNSGSLAGDNGFVFNFYESRPHKAAVPWTYSHYLRHDLLPVDDFVRVLSENIHLPEPPPGEKGSGSLAVNIDGDHYIIPVYAYVGYASGFQTISGGLGYNTSIYSTRVSYSAVPEPATVALTGVCLSALFYARRRRLREP